MSADVSLFSPKLSNATGDLHDSLLTSTREEGVAMQQIRTLETPSWRSENRKCEIFALLDIFEVGIRKVRFFGILSREDALVQDRHGSHIGPRGPQLASNNMPHSLFPPSQESDISTPPFGSGKPRKMPTFSHCAKSRRRLLGNFGGFNGLNTQCIAHKHQLEGSLPK